jgi:hypothetical protein
MIDTNTFDHTFILHVIHNIIIVGSLLTLLLLATRRKP